MPTVISKNATRVSIGLEDDGDLLSDL